MFMFLLGVLFGSGVVLAYQELRRQFSTWFDDRVQAETDRRLQSLADLEGWGYVEPTDAPKPMPKDSTLSEFDARWAGDNGATIVSTPDTEW